MPPAEESEFESGKLFKGSPTAFESTEELDSIILP